MAAAFLSSLAILSWGPILGLATQDFPILMPKAHPTMEEAYLCTPVRVTDTETFYVTGFKPNATAHTAHHMLVINFYKSDKFGFAWHCDFFIGVWM